MIDLTPLDVRKKKEDFRRSVRGYDPEQVAAFLEIVAERLEQLVTENRVLTDRLASLEERLNHYRQRERALNEALLAAQELREEARSQAERDAAVRLREAETHAEAILLEADQAIRHSHRRLKEIRAQRAHLLRTLRGIVERFTETVALEEARLEAEPEELDDLLERLERDAPLTPRGAEPPDGSAAPSAPAASSTPEASSAPGTSPSPPAPEPSPDAEKLSAERPGGQG